VTDADQPPDSLETQKLLAELVETQDFPALSQTIVRINEIVGSETSQADELTRAILRDVSLTNKLLRLVNAAHYGKFGGRPINTVSRAVVILGFNTVRDVALSLMLFEHLQNHAQAKALKGEALETYYCGVIGRRLGHLARLPDVEEAFISALFIQLGRLMSRFYFFERTQRVAALMEARAIGEDEAAREVFGTTYDQLGLAIARHWRLPATLLQGMSRLPAGAAIRATTAGARLQATANLARELLDLAAADLYPREQARALNALGLRYAQVGHFPGATLHELLQEAAEEVKRDALIFQSDVGASALLRRTLRLTGEPAAAAEGEEVLQAAQAADTLPILAAMTPEPSDPASLLTAGLADLTDALIGKASVSDILHMVLESYYRTGCFDRVMIAVRDRDGKSLTGRFGFGKDIDDALRVFRVSLAAAHDAFQVAAAQNVDILISDADAVNIRARIPEWHRRRIGAHSFLLLPLTVDQKAFALLYLDSDSGPLDLDPKVLGLMKVLRNQALLAVRQQPG